MAVKPHPTIEGAYLIDYRPDGRNGKRVYETNYGSRESAEARHTELKLSLPGRKQTFNQSINDILPEYLQWLQLYRSPAYYKSMVWALDKLKPIFGKQPISRITPALIDEFVQRHKATPAHCNQCIDYLKAIIGWMIKRRYAQPLTFRIEKLRHFRSLPQPPDPGDFDKFFEALKENLKAEGITPAEREQKELLVLMIYETGLRWVEARHITWENLRKDGRLYLGRTKTGEARYTVISGETMQRLEKYRKTSGYVFINSATGKPYLTIRKLIQGARVKSGVNIKGTHGLRHALGTDMQEATGDIRATQDALGHTNIKTTQKYIQVAIGRKRQALEQTSAWREEQKAAQKRKAKKVDTEGTSE